MSPRNIIPATAFAHAICRLYILERKPGPANFAKTVAARPEESFPACRGIQKGFQKGFQRDDALLCAVAARCIGGTRGFDGKGRPAS